MDGMVEYLIKDTLFGPPPVVVEAVEAVEAVVEKLCRNYHLHGSNLHIVIDPRLFTSRWRK